MGLRDRDFDRYNQFIRHFAIRDATLTLNKFPVDSTAMNAEKEWKFWLLQFEDFVQLTVDAGAFHMMLESTPELMDQETEDHLRLKRSTTLTII
ncbi:hypothetical protein T4E_5681 [Trichinella pseudospiralis]|uniref:Uncharacterized protein n=1 Tax=Trichinella pseudospiralis TaxID=6337 RepID=A0A0V0XS34_TRIPS|nr:hypothetical protein T4E_5681 [Trichinella pseudospiralis]